MNGLFKYDGPLMSALNKIGDLVILNLITILFCIPIVTIGASLTACSYAGVKLHRDEGHICRNFWKAFKENFVQSTIIYAVLIFVGMATVFSIWVIKKSIPGAIGSALIGFQTVFIIILLFIAMWVFPIQAKFINPIAMTFFKASVLAFRYLFRTVAMLIIWSIPIILVLTFSHQWYLFLVIFGFSGPTYVSVKLYDKVFLSLEETVRTL